MHLSRFHILLLASVLVVLLGIVALAATASTTSRHALLGELERAAVPARASGGRGFRVARMSATGSSIVLVLGPNRAHVANSLALRLTDHGRPVSGARVRVSFSMPSMGMWNAYMAVLAPAGVGRYSAVVPVLGMAGRWRLGVVVVSGVGGSSRFVVMDGLGA